MSGINFEDFEAVLYQDNLDEDDDNVNDYIRSNNLGDEYDNYLYNRSVNLSSLSAIRQLNFGENMEDDLPPQVHRKVAQKVETLTKKPRKASVKSVSDNKTSGEKEILKKMSSGEGLSVSFLNSNLQLAGFGNTSDALLQTVRELVENSIDSGAKMVRVVIEPIVKRSAQKSSHTNMKQQKHADQIERVRVTVDDDGSGIAADKLLSLVGHVFSTTKSGQNVGDRNFNSDQEMGMKKNPDSMEAELISNTESGGFGRYGIGLKALILYAQGKANTTSMASQAPLRIWTATADSADVFGCRLGIDLDTGLPFQSSTSFTPKPSLSGNHTTAIPSMDGGLGPAARRWSERSSGTTMQVVISANTDSLTEIAAYFDRMTLTTCRASLEVSIVGRRLQRVQPLTGTSKKGQFQSRVKLLLRDSPLFEQKNLEGIPQSTALERLDKLAVEAAVMGLPIQFQRVAGSSDDQLQRRLIFSPEVDSAERLSVLLNDSRSSLESHMGQQLVLDEDGCIRRAARKEIDSFSRSEGKDAHDSMGVSQVAVKRLADENEESTDSEPLIVDKIVIRGVSALGLTPETFVFNEFPLKTWIDIERIVENTIQDIPIDKSLRTVDHDDLEHGSLNQSMDELEDEDLVVGGYDLSCKNDINGIGSSAFGNIQSTIVNVQSDLGDGLMDELDAKIKMESLNHVDVSRNARVIEKSSIEDQFIHEPNTPIIQPAQLLSSIPPPSPVSSSRMKEILQAKIEEHTVSSLLKVFQIPPSFLQSSYKINNKIGVSVTVRVLMTPLSAPPASLHHATEADATWALDQAHRRDNREGVLHLLRFAAGIPMIRKAASCVISMAIREFQWSSVGVQLCGLSHTAGTEAPNTKKVLPRTVRELLTKNPATSTYTPALSTQGNQQSLGDSGQDGHDTSWIDSRGALLIRSCSSDFPFVAFSCLRIIVDVSSTAGAQLQFGDICKSHLSAEGPWGNSVRQMISDSLEDSLRKLREENRGFLVSSDDLHLRMLKSVYIPSMARDLTGLLKASGLGGRAMTMLRPTLTKHGIQNLEQLRLALRDKLLAAAEVAREVESIVRESTEAQSKGENFVNYEGISNSMYSSETSLDAFQVQLLKAQAALFKEASDNIVKERVKEISMVRRHYNSIGEKLDRDFELL